jgi:hypothetical protein
MGPDCCNDGIEHDEVHKIRVKGEIRRAWTHLWLVGIAKRLGRALEKERLFLRSLACHGPTGSKKDLRLTQLGTSLIDKGSTASPCTMASFDPSRRTRCSVLSSFDSTVMTGSG